MHVSPCTALFDPARLLILKETILPARLIKLVPFWILLLVVSKKKVESAEIAIKMLQQPGCSNPRQILIKKSPFHLTFSSYLLPCTII